MAAQSPGRLALGPGAGGSIVISATAGGPGSYTNRALIGGLYDGAESVEGSADWTATIGGGDPYVGLMGPAVLIPGEVAAYTIVYGEAAGQDINAPQTLNVSLPQGFAAGDILTDTSGLQAVDTASGRSWTVGALAAGSRLTFTLTLRVPNGIADAVQETTTLTLSTTVSSNQPSNDTASHIARASWHVHTVQGRRHRSPLEGASVANVAGVVTARWASGFAMQDWLPDGDAGTSEGIFVETGGAPEVEVGDLVLVDGTVAELRPAGANADDYLTLTTLMAPSGARVWSSGRPLPAPEVIGAAGRLPPDSTLSDVRGDLESSVAYDPGLYAVDFFESLEGMRVQVNDAVVVGPTANGSEFVVLPDGGTGAAARTPRGGALATQSTLNPDRILARGDWLPGVPDVSVGDRFGAPLIGLLDYGPGAYRLQLTAPAAPVGGGLARETAQLPLPDQLSVATLDIGHLSPQDPAARFSALAALIAGNLRAPDLIAVQGIQDNSGAADDGVVDASQTFGMLIDAIRALDGNLVYEYRDVDPLNNANGGVAGANARVGFLYRAGRGLAFVDRSPGDATTGTAVAGATNGPELTHTPGLIDPMNAAFAGYPEAFGRRVHLQRAPAVRDHCPLRLAGCRWAAVRPLSAASRQISSSARSAGGCRERLRESNPGDRSGSRHRHPG